MKTIQIHKISGFVLFILLFLFLFGQIHAQQRKFLFNQLGVSLNRTLVKDKNTENRIGFGFLMHHVPAREKNIGFVYGFEFTRSNQFKKHMYNGHYSSKRNMTYGISGLSFPVLIRISSGNRFVFYFQAGAYFEIHITDIEKGSVYTNLPGQQSTAIKIKDNAGLKTWNYGPALGIGLRIPFKTFELDIALSSRYGIRELYSYFNTIVNQYYFLSVSTCFGQR